MKSSLFLNSILKVNLSFMKTYRCTGADVALQNLSVENIPPKSLSSYSSTCSKQFLGFKDRSACLLHTRALSVWMLKTAVEGVSAEHHKAPCWLLFVRFKMHMSHCKPNQCKINEWRMDSALPLDTSNAANIRGNFACLMMHVVRICEFTVCKLPLTGVLYVSIIWVKSKSFSFPGIKNLGFEITSV